MCQCQDGFGGFACSLKLDIGPNITSVVGGQTCDVSSGQDCERLALMGSEFVESDQLLCHITSNVSLASFFFILYSLNI